jgi:hypothetical protein
MSVALDGVASTEVGHGWDVAKLPDGPGVALYFRLMRDHANRARLGRIVLSAWSATTYWLIPTGTSPAAWPRGCRILSRGSWIVLPDTTVHISAAWWLHHPAGGPALTGATWLAQAINDFTGTP